MTGIGDSLRTERTEAMNDLLQLAMNAHGGMTRWRQVSKISAHVSISGAMWGCAPDRPEPRLACGFPTNATKMFIRANTLKAFELPRGPWMPRAAQVNSRAWSV